MPEENGKLVVSDEVIKQCNSTVPTLPAWLPRAIQRRHAAADVGAGQRWRRRPGARRKPGRDSGLGKGGHMATENNGFINWTRTSSAFWKT